MTRFYTLLFSCIVFLVSIHPCSYASDSSIVGSLSVLGVTNNHDEPEWRDNRIGFGLSERIAQIMYDSGYFQLIEQDGPQSNGRERLSRMWQKKELSRSDVAAYAKKWGVAYIVYGSVVSVKKTKTKAYVGPVTSHGRTSIVTIELCLYEHKTGRFLCEKGKGKAKVKARSLVFEFQDDRVDWDKSTFGKATDTALNDAAQSLLKKARKKWKIGK